MNLEIFFNPHSIAVIGATPSPEKVGYAVMKNLMEGVKRAIYPVNKESSEVLGVPAHVSVTDIDAEIDLAIIAIRSEFVADVLAECGKADHG